MRTKIDRTVAGLGVAALLAGLAACGSGGGTTETAAAPSRAELSKPATGTLRIFAYEDSITPDLIKPFEQQNPDLEVETASFDSDSEAAAKLSGGFQADVIEICMDEAPVLLDQNLLRPLDPAGVTDWKDLTFHDNKGIREADGKVFMVPLSAGFHGIVYNTDAIKGKIDSFSDLYDPKYKGRVGIESDYPLPPIATTALAMGIKDPTHLSPSQIERVSDYMDAHKDQFRALLQTESDTVNLLKSGEIVIADGDSNADAQILRKEGVPAKSVAPKEGGLSWVCGYGLSSKAKNLDAAYRFINYSASTRAQSTLARKGFVIANPKAMSSVPKQYRVTADPSILKEAIPEIHPPHYDLWTKALEQFQTG